MVRPRTAHCIPPGKEAAPAVNVAGESSLTSWLWQCSMHFGQLVPWLSTGPQQAPSENRTCIEQPAFSNVIKPVNVTGPQGWVAILLLAVARMTREVGWSQCRCCLFFFKCPVPRFIHCTNEAGGIQEDNTSPVKQKRACFEGLYGNKKYSIFIKNTLMSFSESAEEMPVILLACLPNEETKKRHLKYNCF